MMKTALSIIQEFCYRSGVITAPTALAGSTDPQVLKLMYCLKAACEKLREAKCWTCQKRTYSFDTEDARSKYPLPLDFYAPVLRTHFNQNSRLRLTGPISDSAMNYVVYGAGDSATEFSYRIFGPDVDRVAAGQMELTPTPASVQTLSFDYLTRNLFIPADWDSTSRTVYEDIAADTYLCLFDYDLAGLGLEAEYLQRSDADNTAAMVAFEDRIKNAIGRHRGASIGSFETKDEGPRYYVPQTGGWSF